MARLKVVPLPFVCPVSENPLLEHQKAGYYLPLLDALLLAILEAVEAILEAVEAVEGVAVEGVAVEGVAAEEGSAERTDGLLEAPVKTIEAAEEETAEGMATREETAECAALGSLLAAFPGVTPDGSADVGVVTGAEVGDLFCSDDK